MKKEFLPNLKTPPADFCKEEVNKAASNFMRGKLHSDLRDLSKGDLPWEAEQLAKSYGIYLEYNRAKTGTEKDWMYMVRVTIPGGGPLTHRHWLALNAIATKYANTPEESGPSLRLTTRQNIQFHWIKKDNVINVVRELAESGLKTLNGCGDNIRNVMACPLSAQSNIFNANHWAKRIASYFELPEQPFIQIFEIDPNFLRTPEANVAGEEEVKFKYGPGLLNRKFKIAVGSLLQDSSSGEFVPDNCVEMLTNDLAVAPVIQDHALAGFQIYIGGGQGEKNGKPTMAALAKPFAFVQEDQLLIVLDAIVKVHQEWGDRQNRHWARIKYVVKKMGIEWFRDRVQERITFELQPALAPFDVGQRHLHHDWYRQSDGRWSFGMFVENGRLIDNNTNGQLRSAILHVLNSYPVEVVLTPNQDLIFTNISDDFAEAFEFDLKAHGYGFRNSKPYSTLRKLSGACVGRNTCRLAYTDSEKFEPFLIDQLEAMGWGDIATSIGITGCERQCFRPATKAIGLVGTGFNIYQLKLFGTEDARHQGGPLIASDGETSYLRAIPRDQVANVIDALFQLYVSEKNQLEEVGYCLRRIGSDRIIAFLNSHSNTSHLMEKSYSTKDILEPRATSSETECTKSGDAILPFSSSIVSCAKVGTANG